MAITAAQRYNITTFYVNGEELITEIGATNASIPKDLARSLSRGVPNLVVGENVIGLRLFQNGPSTSPIFDGTFTLTTLNIFNHNEGSNDAIGCLLYTSPSPRD